MVLLCGDLRFGIVGRLLSRSMRSATVTMAFTRS
jgi:hypothetical protein